MGYFGIFVGMTLESTFLPIPSELILIPAGVLIAKGEFLFFPVLLASILGSVLGAIINYSLALFLGRTAVDALISRYGKFFFIGEKSMDKSEKLFKNYGNISTFIGRLIPGARHLISLPAGFFRMDMKAFLFFTAIGSGIWTCILLGIGYFFNQVPLETLTKNNFDLYITSFLICSIVLIGYLILRQKKK